MALQDILQSKKILLFSVSFFNYEKIIAERLKELGADVDFYDERPSNSIFVKGLIRLKRDLCKVQIDKYYKRILHEIKNKRYDYFLLIKGEVVPDFFIEELKALNPNIIMIYYNYDSFKNNPNARSILKYFDKKFSFDKKDAIEYKINFRPLFFSNEYEEIRNFQANSQFESMFIGTAHTDRYLISEKVKSWCDSNNFRSFAYYYSPSKYVFHFKRIFDKTFKKFDIKKISFLSLAHGEIIELYKKSKAVLDINHPFQTGLTMRTFEALGAGRKLITTNAQVMDYPFFDPENILVIDRNNIVLNSAFFQTNFKAISNETLFLMSLDGWIDCLFNKEQDEYWLKND
jgi:hypothetical protein